MELEIKPEQQYIIKQVNAVMTLQGMCVCVYCVYRFIIFNQLRILLTLVLFIITHWYLKTLHV